MFPRSLSPSTGPNRLLNERDINGEQAHAANTAMSVLFQTEHQWRGVADGHRSADASDSRRMLLRYVNFETRGDSCNEKAD